MDRIMVTTPACLPKTNEDRRAYCDSPCNCNVIMFLKFWLVVKGEEAYRRGYCGAPYGYDPATRIVLL